MAKKNKLGRRTIYADEKLWLLFQKQSLDKHQSVSDRIREFIRKEVAK